MMQDEMLGYYERELAYLRKLAREFAGKYPKIASRLFLEKTTGASVDPHVERLLQGFAFLAARIHRKIDDDLPEITEALLNILYPHYLAPIPAMSIVQFQLDPAKGKLTNGYAVERNTLLHSKGKVDGTSCTFRTCYPVTLWPIALKSVRGLAANLVPEAPARAQSVITLELHGEGGAKFSGLELAQLRFYLHGENNLAYALYELIFNHTVKIELRAGKRKSDPNPVALTNTCLRPAGLGKEEGVLPYPAHAFLGYRLLFEYFTFPEKFLFFDLCGLESAHRAGFDGLMEIQLFLDQPIPFAQELSAENFLLGCAPVVNLFHKTAEPVNLDRTRTEYPVIPDLRRQTALEIYSIDQVAGGAAPGSQPLTLQPFYSLKHAAAEESPLAYWYARRQPAPQKGDEGTDVLLTIVDLDNRRVLPAVESLLIHTTCTNRDLPQKLPWGNRDGDFDLEGASAVNLIRCLKEPTRTLRPPLGGSTQWRLISHLSLNYLSLMPGEQEASALQEILKLYDFSSSAVTQQQIAGIVSLQSERVVRRISTQHGGAMARGLQVIMTFDEEKFVGSSVFLFAAVLERFLGLYVSINSFCQLVATTKQRTAQNQGPLKTWPPRSGEQVLL